jgi:hypothetical protein
MNNLIVYAWLALALFPSNAWAQALPAVKDPLNYPLRQYGLILGVSILGGIVNWYARAKKGEAQTLGISGFIGELATASFAGLLTFWACEYFSLGPLLTPCLAGLAGHAGGRAVIWLEAITRRKVEKTLGVTSPAPLGKD